MVIKKKKCAYTRLAIFLIVFSCALSRCVEQTLLQKIFLAGNFEFILGILSVAMKTLSSHTGCGEWL